MGNKQFLKLVSKSVIIKANKQRVWSVISKKGNLELCHPFCESNPVESWGDKKSIDFVNYYNGLKYQRIFTDWIDGQGYDLLIGKVNRQKSKVIWRINQLNDDFTELKIIIYPHDINKYPSIIKPLINSLYIRPILLKYLSSVLKGFKYYIEIGEPVPKNQFGTHKWFSN